MTQSMMAAVATPTGLALAEVDRPKPSDEQILIRVRVAGMNRADLAAARGAGIASADAYGKPIGMEWAGEVVATGIAVTDRRVGELVACSGTGGYAEYAVADQHRVLPLQPTQDIAAAAVLPLALMTASDALHVAGIRAGDRVFVRGASSAVGLATMQVAKLLGAPSVLGGARSAEKRTRLTEFGANQTIDTARPDWVEAVLIHTDRAGADVVIDMVGGTDLNELMKATAVGGRIVNVGRLAGTSTEFDLNLHALRRIAFHGTTFRTRSLAEVRQIVGGVAKTLWPHVGDGSLALPIDHQFALSEAVEAHAYMAANRHFGKLALTV